MTNTIHTLPKDEDVATDAVSEPGAAPHAADETPGAGQPAGKRYLELADPDDPWANYDPDAFRAALRKVAGLYTPEEADRLIENIYRAREEGTRPIDRP